MRLQFEGSLSLSYDLAAFWEELFSLFFCYCWMGGGLFGGIGRLGRIGYDRIRSLYSLSLFCNCLAA